jgi:hypothetical protein
MAKGSTQVQFRDHLSEDMLYGLGVSAGEAKRLLEWAELPERVRERIVATVLPQIEADKKRRLNGKTHRTGSGNST